MTAYTDFHYSPTGSGVISGAQVLEQTEQGINGLGQYVQDNVSGAIDTANQALTIAQTADSNATLALNTANSFASAISAANNTANNALTTAQSAQNTANTASSLATTANNNANTALNAANTATSNVATLTGTVNSLGNRMTTAENAISTNAGNITTLQTNLQTTNNNVTAAANAASSAQATATSAQSTATLARNQAYVLRYTGTTITGGGTIAYADIDNTDNIKAGDKIIDISGAIYDIASVDTANQTVTVGASPVINLFCDAENLIPAATDTYDLGSSSYQWNNLYAQNYYYNGVAWGLDKENTWTGDNTFSNTLYVQTGYTLGTLPQAESAVTLFTGRTTDNNFATSINFYQNPTRGTGLRFTIRNKWDNNGYSTTGTTRNAHFELLQSINKTAYMQWEGYVNNSLYPLANNTYDLGSSSYKWKTLNGINPGALSLPNVNAVTGSSNTQLQDISGDLVQDQYFNCYFTPRMDGWAYIALDCSNATIRSGHSSYTVSAKTARSFANALYAQSFTKTESAWSNLVILFPVTANKEITLECTFTGFSVTKGYVIPCLGNV